MTSLKISGSRRIESFLDFAQNDKGQQSKRTLFAHLAVQHDEKPHPAPMNMSIDEALLNTATIPTIRFYRWRSPALSFGYFGKFCEVAIYAAQRDLVRRWTGGGVVFHGDDLTYSLVIPARDQAFGESSMTIYEQIHRALCGALAALGQPATVAGVGDPGLQGAALTRAGISGAGYSCFANPVRADVMVDGRKIAGAAQRRTRRGLLQQGSIQGIALKAPLAQKFAEALSARCRQFAMNEQFLQRAHELARQKYETDSWLRKR